MNKLEYVLLTLEIHSALVIFSNIFHTLLNSHLPSDYAYIFRS